MNIKQEIGEVAQRIAPGIGAGTLGWYAVYSEQVITGLTVIVLLLTAVGYAVKIIMDFRRNKRADRIAAAVLSNYRTNPNPDTLAAVQQLLQKQDAE